MSIITKWETKKQEETNKGITLIALVITIIVLLILAGITIATLTGENGILSKSNVATQENQKVSAKEKVQIAVMGSVGTDGKIEMDTLNENLNQVEGIDKEKSQLPIKNLPEIVVVDNYNVYIEGNGMVTIDGEKIEDHITLPSTEDTKPFLLESSEIISKNLDTGLVIKDKNQNEWVWIEVPKSIYSEGTTNTDYTAIETAMQTYASDYRVSGWTDTFYSTEQHGFANEIEYNNHKNNMLKSVFENGGFYIGRYETGTNTPRISSSDSLTTPVIQRDMYPYNFVTCRQAQTIATELATGGKTSSLMFGIQWDLVMKFIEEKGVKTKEEVKINSKEWGNYNDSTFEITRGLYTTEPKTSDSWNRVSETSQYTKVSLTKVLLTTGATERNSVLRIYDLAGNVNQWTLEKTATTTEPCADRGGAYDDNSTGYPASDRLRDTASSTNETIGCRVVLW